MTPTTQQAAFLQALVNTSANLALVARAGCGKTSTILLAVKQEVARNPRIEAAIVCYGAAIKAEIEAKLKAAGFDWKQVQASTTHALGWGLVRFAFRLGNDAIDDNKVRDIIRAQTDDVFTTYGSQINKLVQLAKGEGFGFFPNRQIGDASAWYSMADHYDVNGFDDTTDMDAVIDAAQRVYRISLTDTTKVDFSDLVLFPLIKNLRVKFQKDLVFVDEAQDTSPARQALIRKFVKPSGRVVLVGDDRQAIMGFSGADVDALPNMIRDFNATALPLSITWRCPKAVVRIAQGLVPDIEAAPEAPEGSVSFVKELPLADLGEGDAVLCRNTAPLISLAYKLIRAGKPCKVEGRSIGEGLQQLVRRWKVKTIDALLGRLEVYEDREVQKAQAKGNDAKVEEVQDRVATLREICQACIEQKKTEVSDVDTFINNLFADGVTGCIVLATGHKSKGREWDNVYLFEYSTRCPSKAAKQPHAVLQEYNLMYVMITRSMKSLVFVG